MTSCILCYLPITPFTVSSLPSSVWRLYYSLSLVFSSSCRLLTFVLFLRLVCSSYPFLSRCDYSISFPVFFAFAFFITNFFSSSLLAFPSTSSFLVVFHFALTVLFSVVCCLLIDSACLLLLLCSLSYFLCLLCSFSSLCRSCFLYSFFRFIFYLLSYIASAFMSCCLVLLLYLLSLSSSFSFALLLLVLRLFSSLVFLRLFILLLICNLVSCSAHLIILFLTVLHLFLCHIL